MSGRYTQREGAYLPQREYGEYLPKRDYGGYLPQRDNANGGYFPVPQRDKGGYLPQRDNGGYFPVPRRDNGGYMPQKDNGGHVPQRDAGEFMPKGDIGGYMPKKDNGGYVPQSDYGEYVPQSYNGGYLPQRENGTYCSNKESGGYGPQRETSGGTVVCQHFLRGQCKFGDKCWMFHPKQNQPRENPSKQQKSPNINRDKYQPDKCTDDKETSRKKHSDVTPVHKDEVLVKTKEEKIEKKMAPICVHFQRGICRYGEKCWKRHEKIVVDEGKCNASKSPYTDNTCNGDAKSELNVKTKFADGTSNKAKANTFSKNIFENLSISEVNESVEEFDVKNEVLLNKGVSVEAFKSETQQKKIAKVEKQRLKKIEKFKESGDSYFKEKKYSAAIDAYTRVINLTKANNETPPAIFSDRAASYMMLKNYPSALQDVRKVVNLNPDNIQAHIIVRCCLALGNLEEGMFSLNHIKDDPNYVSLKSQYELAGKLEKEAIKVGKEGRFADAIIHLVKLLNICSHCSRFRCLRALYLAQDKKYTQADEILKSMDKKDEDVRRSNTFCFAEAIIKYYKDDMDRAISGFDKVKKEFPESVEWKTRAQAMRNAYANGNRGHTIKNDYSTAKKAYDEGLAMDTSNKVYMIKLFLARADLEQNFKKFEEAIEDCNKCIELDAENYEAWSKRGNIKLIQEDFSGAVEDLKMAHTIRPSFESSRRLQDARRKEKQAEGGKQTHYQVLGVERNASLDEIKKAYRAKAKEFHPDKHAMATKDVQLEMETKMKTISVAYQCLSDTIKRRVYDYKLDEITDSDDDSDIEFDEDDSDFDINDLFGFDDFYGYAYDSDDDPLEAAIYSHLKSKFMFDFPY